MIHKIHKTKPGGTNKKKTTHLMRPTRGSLATDLFIDGIQDFNRTFGTKQSASHICTDIYVHYGKIMSRDKP